MNLNDVHQHRNKGSIEIGKSETIYCKGSLCPYVFRKSEQRWLHLVIPA